MLLLEGILKIYSSFTGEHPCVNVNCNFIEITFRRGCSPINLPCTFRTLFPKNTSRGLLLSISSKIIVLLTKIIVLSISKQNHEKDIWIYFMQKNEQYFTLERFFTFKHWTWFFTFNLWENFTLRQPFESLN